MDPCSISKEFLKQLENSLVVATIQKAAQFAMEFHSIMIEPTMNKWRVDSAGER